MLAIASMPFTMLRAKVAIRFLVLAALWWPLRVLQVRCAAMPLVGAVFSRSLLASRLKSLQMQCAICVLGALVVLAPSIRPLWPLHR